METGAPEDDRRRLDRRNAFVRLADYTIPEVRKALITSGLLLVLAALFLYMIHEVIVALITGVVFAVYFLPLHRRMEIRIQSPAVRGVLTLLVVILPLVAVLSYSWVEISGAAAYMNENRDVIAARVTEAIQRLPFGTGLEVRDDVPRWVAAAADRAAAIVDDLQEAVGFIALNVAVFLFTAFYVLTDHERITTYALERVPGRYRGLADRVIGNVRRVTYGALYATFLTQLVKSAIVLAMNLAWDVPLAVVLAIVAFFVGFLPIVGSWSVYIPVGLYLMVFRDDLVGGVAMILIGLLVNTFFISLYLRPKIAAEKSGVLNFYWMFIALVTGVYTFGLAGIIIGPILIAILRAVFESIARPRTGAAGVPAAPAAP